MNRWERWSLHALTVILGVTGVAYWGMRTLLESDDPFAVVNHPWEPAMMAAHVLAAPLFVLVFGIILQSHIRSKLGRRLPNRRSGLLGLYTFGIMLVSGYAIQVVTAPLWRDVMVAAHLASGFVFLAAYIVHQVVSIRMHLAARRREQHTTVAA